ncbi:MFS transporter [Nonomuraea sp. B19D2]|uniref:MFS transporter n=1 Tax=Nonomuraea sp. B19D2 TaxID=3159561 RepID=UPI0032DB93BC
MTAPGAVLEPAIVLLQDLPAEDRQALAELINRCAQEETDSEPHLAVWHQLVALASVPVDQSHPCEPALLLALGVFVAGNAATALGTTYTAVMTARVITAAGAGIIGSTAFSVAAAIAPPHRHGRALAFVMGGLTIATAVGLPLGTLIGRAGWRVTLWAVAGLGLVAGIGIAVGVPPVRSADVALGDRLAPLKQRWVIGVLAVSMITLAGIHTLYTYIGPALSKVTSPATRPGCKMRAPQGAVASLPASGGRQSVLRPEM